MTSISIIIPIYNVEPYIASCLHSVMAQTYTGSIECILVDDCGQDDSIGVAKKVIANYQGPIRFHILHHEHNRGLSAARNTGMKATSGNYLFFLDSDDEIPANAIELLVKPLSEETYDIVVGNTLTIGNDDLHEYLRMKLDDGAILRYDEIIDCYKTKWNMLAQAKLYNRDFICNSRLSFKEGIIHEDELWSFQAACVARSLRAVSHNVYHYYIRENSITAESNKNNWKKIEAKEIIAGEMTSFLHEHGIFSAPAYNIIQTFIEEILHTEKCDRERFRRAYLSLRKSTYFPWYYRLRAKGMNLKSQIQQLNYFLPTPIGERYKYWRISR